MTVVELAEAPSNVALGERLPNGKMGPRGERLPNGQMGPRGEHGGNSSDQNAVRQLVSSITFTRVRNRIAADNDVSLGEADDILDATLLFLAAIARHPGAGLCPSRQVDLGWHTFILYTKEYAEFCQKTAGHFIHHCPNDDPSNPQELSLQSAIEFFTANQIPFNIALWVNANADCNSSCKADCDGGSWGGGGACKGQCS